MFPQRHHRHGTRALGLCLALLGCHRTHYAVTSVPELPYPTCDHGALPPGDILAAGHLRAGHTSLEKNVEERFEIRRRDCLVVATVHQDWPLDVTDVEVVYDRAMNPLRAWRRSSLPGVNRPGGFMDTRRYELRTPEVTVTRRSPEGVVSYEVLRGGIPRVILGPGRGLVTVWLQRAHLPVGGRARELALDIRERLETLSVVSLRRSPDQYVPALGRIVRVYTVYGRESVFADEHDVVLGDLAGSVPASTPGLPPLPLLPPPPPPDPQRSP